jgi:SAM-dependent methyltransferase
MANVSDEPNPNDVLQLATGYQRSKILFALVELGVPGLLDDSGLDCLQLAARLEIHPVAADRFLNACVGLGLLEKSEGAFQNSRISSKFLVKGKTDYLGDQCLHYDRSSYKLWADLVDNLKSWEPGDGKKRKNAKQTGGGDPCAQHNLSLLTGRSMAERFDFSPYRLILDLGGGTGAMSIGICQTHDQIKSTVYDLAEVTEIARQNILKANLSDRIEVKFGDFKHDPLPAGFDVALLANLVSVADEETNRRLLRNICDLLPHEGVCIISGWILDDSRTSPLMTVLFCLEDIGWDAPDVERTESRYREWFIEAGFAEVERIALIAPASMLVARKR